MDGREPDKAELVAALEALRIRVAELDGAHKLRLDRVTREHRQTEAALRLSEQKLSRIFSESPDAIVISSLATGRYVDVNPAFEKVFGFSPAEAIGRETAELGIWPEAAQRDKLVALLRERGELMNQEVRFRHKSGRLFDSLFSASLTELEGESCMLSITRDISERKRIEQLFLEQNRMLDAVSQAQGDFIADADAQVNFSRLLSHLLDITDS